MSARDDLAGKLSEWHENWCEENENLYPFHADSWKHVADSLLSAGWVKPEYEWATKYATEPQPIRAISEESARELAAMTDGVELLKRSAAGAWVVVDCEPS